MAEKNKKRWIQKAVPESHKGIFTEKAHAAGKSVSVYASEKSGAPGKLGHEARLAQTFEKMGHKKKSPLYTHVRSHK